MLCMYGLLTIKEFAHLEIWNDFSAVIVHHAR